MLHNVPISLECFCYHVQCTPPERATFHKLMHPFRLEAVITLLQKMKSCSIHSHYFLKSTSITNIFVNKFAVVSICCASRYCIRQGYRTSTSISTITELKLVENFYKILYIFDIHRYSDPPFPAGSRRRIGGVFC